MLDRCFLCSFLCTPDRKSSLLETRCICFLKFVFNWYWGRMKVHFNSIQSSLNYHHCLRHYDLMELGVVCVCMAFAF